jgi:hypothetical protein
MRPRSSNLPQVGVVFARQVILEKTHQVLEQVDRFALGPQHGETLREQGPALGVEFVPIPLARVRDEAAPAGRRAISVVMT